MATCKVLWRKTHINGKEILPTSRTFGNHIRTGSSQPVGGINLINMSESCTYRWFLEKPRISEKLSDCLVFCCNILTVNSWPPYDCQPIVWMVCWWEKFRRQDLYALAEYWKQEYEYYNINLLGRRLTANLPNLIQTDIRIKCALI